MLEIKLFDFEHNMSAYWGGDLEAVKGASAIWIKGERYKFHSYHIDQDKNEIVAMLNRDE